MKQIPGCAESQTVSEGSCNEGKLDEWTGYEKVRANRCPFWDLQQILLTEGFYKFPSCCVCHVSGYQHNLPIG